MLNVTLEEMTQCASSHERAAVVEFFRVVSQYGQAQYTNAVALVMAAFEPAVRGTPLERLCAHEPVEAMRVALDTGALPLALDDRCAGVDVPGIALFCSELLLQHAADQTTPNYAILLLVVAHIAYATRPARPAALELLATFLDTNWSDAAPETLARIDATVRTLVTHAAAALDQAPATHMPLLRLLAVLVVRRTETYVALLRDDALDAVIAAVAKRVYTDWKNKDEILLLGVRPRV